MLPRKSIPATEIKNRFGRVLGNVVRQKKAVVIERHGRPAAVIVDIAQWQNLTSEKGTTNPDVWTESFSSLLEKIRRNHARPKSAPSVRLIRKIREEE